MKRKNILDEMQEQKRLKIESNGLWIAFFGLLAVTFMQTAIAREPQFSMLAGELIVIFVLAIYLIPCYIKHGIWSTTLKLTFKTNCMISACAGLGVALFWGILSYVRYGKLTGSIATAVFMLGSMFALCIALLTLCAWFYQRRVKKLEDAPETKDE